MPGVLNIPDRIRLEVDVEATAAIKRHFIRQTTTRPKYRKVLSEATRREATPSDATGPTTSANLAENSSSLSSLLNVETYN